MHVGFVTNEYPPLPTGGIGTSVRNLARALVARGHRVTVLGWGRDMEFEDRGVRVRFVTHAAVPKLGWLLLRRVLQRELTRMVRHEGLQVVEVPDWCGVSAGMRVPCPVLIRCHGSATYFGHLLGDRVRPSVALAERVALRQADGVAAVSRFTAELTSSLFGLRLPVHVIHNGIDIAQFDGDASSAEPDTVLSLGTIVRKKGVLDVCQMFSRLVTRRPQARLIVVGRDAADQRTGSPSTWALCREQLSSEAARRVDYLGEQPYDVVQEHLRRATVCLFPSYAEALGNVWLEAMGCGRPIVGYGTGWASEIVEPNGTGLLVPVGDVESGATAVESILADPAWARSLGAAGRRRAETHFSASVAADRSCRWFERAIQGHQ